MSQTMTSKLTLRMCFNPSTPFDASVTSKKFDSMKSRRIDRNESSSSSKRTLLGCTVLQPAGNTISWAGDSITPEKNSRLKAKRARLSRNRADLSQHGTGIPPDEPKKKTRQG